MSLPFERFTLKIKLMSLFLRLYTCIWKKARKKLVQITEVALATRVHVVNRPGTCMAELSSEFVNGLAVMMLDLEDLPPIFHFAREK